MPDSQEPEDEGLEETVLEDRYKLERRIGSGGMGTVYLAQQLALRIPVAIKVLHRERSEDFTSNYRLLREARVAARVAHPNVTRVLDIGRTPDGLVFTVMEYLEGEDLSQRLQREGMLPWPAARRILRQVVRGLWAAHAIGVVHRDVKPSNVFLVAPATARPEQVKLLDFGLAKAENPTDTFGEHLSGDAIYGTVEYISPERVLGERADVRSDIYSVGVMMFEMLTGHRPWPTDNLVRSMMQRVREQPPPLPAFIPGVPTVMSEVVRRAMARDPEHRFATLRELYEVLRDAVPIASANAEPGAAVVSPESSELDEALRDAVPSVIPEPRAAVPAEPVEEPEPSEEPEPIRVPTLRWRGEPPGRR